MFSDKPNLHYGLLWTAAFSSIVFSLIQMNTSTPIVVDGILYLKAASTYLTAGYHATMGVYPWPFFPILIALVKQITHLSLEQAAQIINTCFQVLIVISFISLVRLLGGERLQQRLAAIVILVYPYLNGTRTYITRDFGYWGLALCALIFLLRYAQHGKWKDAFAWGLLMSGATLFRIEGAAFLCFAPLSLLFITHQQGRFLHYIKANSVLFLTGLLLLSYLSLHPTHTIHFGRLPEFIHAIQEGIFSVSSHLKFQAHQLSQTLLGTAGAQHAESFLIGGLITIFLWTLVKVGHPLYMALSVYTMCKIRLPIERAGLGILISFITLNIVILLYFLSQQFFVDNRYVVLLCYLLLLWVPFGSAALYSRYRTQYPRTSLFFFLSLFFLLLLSGFIHTGASKAYIKEAGLFIHDNLPTQARLYSNSPEVLYYAEKPHSNWQVPVNKGASLHDLKLGRWRQYDYLAIRINTHDEETHNALLSSLKPYQIGVFQNARGDRVLIFQIKK